jgi:hypothetical protein
MSEVFHHLVPLLYKGFLEKHLEMISYFVISLSFHHGRSLGLEREVVLKKN